MKRGSWLYRSRSTDQLWTRKSCRDSVFWKTKKMASYAQENTDNSVFIVNTEQVESYTVSKKYGKVCSSMSMNHNKKSLNHLWLNTLEQGKNGDWLHSCYSLALWKQGWERLNIWSCVTVMLLSCSVGYRSFHNLFIRWFLWICRSLYLHIICYNCRTMWSRFVWVDITGW